MFVLMFFRLTLKLGQFLALKLGHWAKSKENFVNTVEVTFLKW